MLWTSAGVLQQQPAALLSYGLALQQTKGTAAQAQALHALEQGLAASPGPQVLCTGMHTVHGMCVRACMHLCLCARPS